MAQEAIFKQYLTVKQLNSIGFKSAPDSDLPKIIQSITPQGSTSLRDAIYLSLQLMIQIHELLKQLEQADNYHFINVVLTDGSDTSSKMSLEDLAKLMFLIGLTIPKKMLQTFFIGIDLHMDKKAQEELEVLSKIGLENAQLLHAQTMNVKEVFQQIQLSIRQQKQLKIAQASNNERQVTAIQIQQQNVLHVEVLNYVILFTLDISGSMNGNRWNQVCSAVPALMSTLGQNDFVGCVVFNDETKLIRSMDDVVTNKLHIAPSAPSTNAQTVQITGKESVCCSIQ